MNMNIALTPAAIKKHIVTFLHRFHVIVFVIIVVGGVIAVILLLNDIVQRSGESAGYTPDTNSAHFDEATIDKIEKLKTRSQNDSQLDFSGGRTNPFVE